MQKKSFSIAGLLLLPLFILNLGAGCIDIQEDTSGTQSENLPKLVSGCGDNVCDEFEQKSGKCPQDCDTPNKEETADPTEPLYLTIVLHNEEDAQNGKIKDNVPNYDGNKELLKFYTKTLRAFAEMVAGHDAKINFGSDWTFSDGVKNFDNRFYLDIENLGHEIDAHAHESQVKYHEVRRRIQAAGGTPTHVASGLKEDNLTNHFAYLDKYYPEFNILWGIASPGHGAGEPIADWVWRPDTANWTHHDPEGKYIYIGGGERVNSLAAVERAIANRKPDRINTYALFISPRDFKADPGMKRIPDEWTADKNDPSYWTNRTIWWDDLLSQLDKYKASGELQYATLSEIADIYIQNEERLTPHNGAIPRSSAPATTRSRAEGYIR
ncbi:hypothetical protein GF391_00910 [Candidatus Uhrbacteria bacterium]|nr:hypothetical protein [Candidatus Uhrbacteria bacterium]